MSSVTVMHVDANSAYLSWTAVDLLEKGYPLDIRTVPAAIAGNPEDRHGIILAKSIPAKKYKIGTGESLYESKQRCPELLLFPPNYDLYLSCSNAMYSILQEYSPVIQRYSVDECFVDFDHCEKRFGRPEAAAFEIKERIKRELGFTVNVGVGNNKLLAKMAGELKKPDLVHTILSQKELEEKLWPLNVRELFMVGRASAKKLNKININTIGDLACSELVLLRSLLKSHGQLIWEYANGIDHDRVTPNDEVLQKSLSNSMTIKYDVTDKREAENYLLSLTDRVAGRLRRHQCKASLIGIGVKTNGFVRYTHQIQLPFFTDDTTKIYRYVCSLFEECWKGEPVRQLGIRLSEFTRKDEYQLSVFDIRQIEEDEALNKVVDEIRDRFGQTAIYRGTFANTDMKPLEGGINDGNYLMMGGYKQ
ncbi:DNA polymerase IV [Emergencia timonensis]|uniref:DNA polymerase IV n=2 Tax=Emergencia timonensis TaxID=1776384 RepID=A0A415E8F3_9FIRM|nr:DNA polymerase IV [Emergencia timonensis]MBS6178620.1 DNA polymerase IV [Clostridiales bacterium]MCB6477426.1 DNA polymerase IV [Emergencia timonensis]RHJ89968.1 DNA polymerase IV [Emergencia timonensis]